MNPKQALAGPNDTNAADDVCLSLNDDERKQALTLAPHSGLQPPDWHWRLARCWLAPFYPTPYADDFVRLAAKFLRFLHGHPAPAGEIFLRQQMPAVLDAYEVYRQPTSPRRWEIEARLLAGQSFTEIAEKCRSTAEAMHCYHELFFDVQPHLDQFVYILNVAIGEKVHSGLEEGDVGMLLKYFAYLGGPPVLELLLPHFKNPQRVTEKPDRLDAAERNAFQQGLLAKALILSKVMPADAKFLKKRAILADALQTFAEGQVRQGPEAVTRPWRPVDMLASEDDAARAMAAFQHLATGNTSGHPSPQAPSLRKKGIGVARVA